MKISVNWLQDFIKMKPPIESIAERLTMAGLEVKKLESYQNMKDQLFEIEVTTNRPDWLSHLGVAREIAAVENLSMKWPETDTVTNRPMPSGWKLDLKEKDGCPYYSGILIEGITQQPTPDFIRERLEACGLRSISLIVDITNYVLLETGQPLHAFDADLLKFQEVKVRRAKAGEKMTAIDGTVLALTAEDLVIADRENPVAIAGVMGGKDTEVTDQSRNIFLESAFFHPRWVRRTSKRLGLASESSYRFERRVDPEGVDYGRARALWLIQKYAKPRFVSAVLKAGEKPAQEKTTLHISEQDIERWIGIPMKGNQIASILTRLGLQVSKTSGTSWKVQIPSFRSDLTRTVDLIEEVTRVYGFDNIPETLPERAPLFIPENPLLKVEGTVRDICAGAGLYESVTFSLISQKGLESDPAIQQSIQIVNPQHKELAWMRPHLAGSFLDVIKKNNHMGTHDVFVYEIANVYSAGEGKKKSAEEKVLSIALFGEWKSKTWLDTSRAVTFYDLKGILLSLLEALGIEGAVFKPLSNALFRQGACEEILIGKHCAGRLGEINHEIVAHWDLESPVFFGELYLERLVQHMRQIRPIQELPRFPAVKRDISLVVPESVKAGDVEKSILKLGGPLVRGVEVFDLFRGKRVPEGHKNMGLRVTYQAQDKTLVSDDVQDLHSKLADALAKQFQASFQ